MLVEVSPVYAWPFEQLDTRSAAAGWLAVRDWLSTGTALYSAIHTGTCTPPIRTLLHAGDLMFHCLASMSVPFPTLPLSSPVQALTRLS